MRGKKLTRILAGSAAVIICMSQGEALAASASTNLSVTATVNANCTISTSPVAFGAYDPVVANASTDRDGTGTVTITCTKGAVTDVTLGLGNNASGSNRRMLGTGSGNFLVYEIYQDAGRTVVWGTGASKLDTGTAPNKNPRSFTAYGRITAGQDVSADSYSDSVLATVNF